MGNSSTFHPRTLTSLDTLTSLLATGFGLCNPLGKAPRTQPRVFPLHLLQPRHIPSPGSSLLLLRHGLPAHTAQLPAPTSRCVFLVTHCHPLCCVTPSPLSPTLLQEPRTARCCTEL